MTVFYVAKTGNNNNSGSINSPWLTIAKATSVAMPGDTVFIRNGTYNEQMVFPRSGSSGAKITFSNYNGESVILDVNGISFGRQGIIHFNGVSFIEVDGIQAVNARISGSNAVGVMFYGNAHDITIRNLYINNTSGPGIQGLYNWNIPTPTGYIYNIVIDHCEVANTNWDGMDEAVSFRAANNCTVSYCKVHDSHGQTSSVGAQKEGIDFKQASNNISIHHNVCYTTKIGIYLDSCNNSQIYNNMCYGNLQDGIALSNEDGGGYTGLVVYNNICFSNNRGITGYNYGGTKSCTIINNTCYHNSSSEILFWNTGYTNCIIRNNIMDGAGSQLLNLPSISGFTIDHNCFYGGGSVTSYGSSAVQSDPKLVNPTSDFHLQSTSPCINTGSNSGAPTIDFDGNSRPQGTYVDIGAYEYVSTTNALIADFSASVNGLVVSFVDTSSGEQPGATYSWNFGD